MHMHVSLCMGFVFTFVESGPSPAVSKKASTPSPPVPEVVPTAVTPRFLSVPPCSVRERRVRRG